MSELIDRYIYHAMDCPSWQAHFNDNGDLQAGPCECDVQKARAELASLRLRAEDAGKAIEYERRCVWQHFHTPAAQKAAEEMLDRLAKSVNQDEQRPVQAHDGKD